MRTLNANLTTAQQVGYPVGGYAPAIQCILYAVDDVTYYDYSFDPTANDNVLRHISQTEHVFEGGSGKIILQNNATVPSDLTGYHTDIGWGMNTADGLKYSVTTRMWVMKQDKFSRSKQLGRPEYYTVLELGDAWSAVMMKQPVRLGSAPYYRLSLAYINDILDDVTNTYNNLLDKTIYACIEYLIETALKAQTGISFTLDALGTQDDGFINNPLVIPFPSDGSALIRDINETSPSLFATYAEVITSLLEITKCTIVPLPNLAFKIMYPQTSDVADETYYTLSSDGIPFYEAIDRKLNMLPNHVEVYGGMITDETLTTFGEPEFVGDWFDSDHYSTPPTRPFTPAEIETAYDGGFMPVTYTIWEQGLASDSACDDRAEQYGMQYKHEKSSSRIVLPMDTSVELYDKVKIENTRT